MDLACALGTSAVCLLDAAFLDSFKKAISSVVRPGDVVLNCIADGGILTNLAAQTGASQVYSCQPDYDSYKLYNRNVSLSGCDNIEIVYGGLTSFDKHADVVLIDVLDTLLLAKEQVNILNNLYYAKVISEQTKLIPTKVSTVFTAIEYDWNWSGNIVPTLLRGVSQVIDSRCRNYICPDVYTDEIGLLPPVIPYINLVKEVVANASGQINALRFSTKMWLTDQIAFHSAMPVIIPIRPCTVKKGDRVNIYVEYWVGHGPNSIEASVSL